ncbi:lasso RiPP family leader peptide-containing protein [Nocardiopsis sp. HNM0947]|uniref:Lasso RiPP family leader peptide-containing protein n=1 Tax=Nocardiopsis coralli TaxID=2772213 RepID=A0ABR9PEN6_9ACTN|nr:lasso RiPP family leader peptide-containing protein [Nocardiopsis coralli]MBE3002305.1 lasso RiPP family leader peptide-containing protein [Nocardiopsis coralli]
MYRPPMLTEIAAFKKDTNGAGSATERDLLGFRAVFVVHPPW